MPLILLLLAVFLTGSPAQAQPSTPQDAMPGQPTDQTPKTSDPGPGTDQEPGTRNQGLDLPVSLDRIREGLEETPTTRLHGLAEAPTFKVAIHEAQRPFTLDELVKSLAPGFKAGPVPAGGVYDYELKRQANNPVDNPLAQPYMPFNQAQLLTVLVENLAGKYLAGKALNAVSSAEREYAESQARAEVQRALTEYCAAQPDGGRGIDICTTPVQ